MSITPDDFPEIRWRGRWIWVAEETIEPAGFWTNDEHSRTKETHALFRKTFTLERPPERVPARITADSRYLLHVNGREVGRGPIRSQPRRLYYDIYDLAPALQSGENVLAVYVKYYGRPNSFWMPATPNNTLGTSGILVFEADLGARGWIVSDASWKAHKADAWDAGRKEIEGDEGGIPIEVFDARRFPANWCELDFDDSGWAAAQIVPAMHVGGFARTQPPTDPYGPLNPRPIAMLDGALRRPAEIHVELVEGDVDASIGNPFKRLQATLDLRASTVEQSGRLPLNLEIPAGKMGRLSLDMGGIVSGFVQFDIDAPAGTVLDLAYTEDPLQSSFSMDKMHAGTRYIARGAQDQFQLFDSNGFRYAYILIHGVQGAVTVRNFAVREHLYPWLEGAGFSCDDEELNRIFRASVRTVQLSSHDAFVDCPTREQRAWVGDGVVHQMVHLATNRDWRMAWHYLTLSNSPRSDGILPMSVAGDIEARGAFSIPDWSLHWIHGLHNLYRFDGDRALVKSLMPTAERILRWYVPYQTSHGVLRDVPEWNLVDWSSVSTEESSAALTALWARGLREFAEMAGWLEEKGSRRWAQGLYEKVRAGFDLFWDERRGSYVDHVVDGVQRPAMSQLPGALAIVSHLAPESRWHRIVDTITDPARVVVRSWMAIANGQQSMERWQQQVRRGVYEIDWDVEEEVVLAQPFMSYVVHDAIVLAGCAERLPDLYRRWSQFLVNGYDTMGECWDFGTHAHGWSGSPARDMIFYTLGVTPAEPGYRRARIAPRLGSLKRASGRVPTPHGLLAIEATATGVTVDSPVPVVVELPGQAARHLPAGRHEIGVE